MVWDQGLEGEYLDAVSFDGPFHRIFAGPGTGKTFSLIRKTCRFLESDVNPRRILLLTFTRVAARDLMKKLVDLGIPEAEHIRTGTLHSFAFTVLAGERVIQQMGRFPRPLLKYELQPMKHDLARALGLNLSDITKLIKKYEAAWAELQTDQPGWAPDREARRFEAALIDWLRFHKSMLIGELVPLCLRYFQTNPQSPFLNQFEYVLVDEYQDLNKAEQVLIDEIAGDAPLSIGGDDEQSIYNFKYANPIGIQSFGDTHQDTYDSYFTQSRRCPISILNLANCLMGHEDGDQRFIHPYRDNPDGEIVPVQWNGFVPESRGIATIVNHYITNRGITPGRVLILVQRKPIADRIKLELDNSGIPSVSYFFKPLESHNAQKRYSLLLLSADPFDRVALRHWLGKDSVNYLSGTYDRLMQYCSRENIEPYNALLGILEERLEISGINRLVPVFEELVNELQAIEGLIGMDLINHIFPENNVNCEDIRRISLEECNDEMECAELIEKIRDRLSQPAEVPDDRDQVSIMSFHKAKGLEGDLVILSSCVEGLIPSIKKNLTPEEQTAQRNENRRLFYVGITRSREILIISSFLYLPIEMARDMSIIYQRSGHVAQVQSSDFIRELGPTCPQVIKGEDFISDF